MPSCSVVNKARRREGNCVEVVRPPHPLQDSQLSISAVHPCLMALCMCQVDSCMGCIPLQRGAIIVGFIYMFGSMMETFKYMYGLVDFELKVRQCTEAEPRTPDMYSDDMEEGPIYQALRDELRFCPKGRMLALTRSAMVIPIFIFFIYFILTALMIHGARQDRPRLIAPWLWWQLSLFVVTILGIIGLQSIEDFLYKISILLVAVYLFMVVNSYYLELLRRERNPSRVTVIAMAHPRSEMMVSLPSPLKDDSPPPYHACYVPNESPYPPPYYAASPGYPAMPPPYQSSDPLMASCSGTTQAEPQTPTTPVAPTTVTVNPTPASPSPVTPNPVNPTPASPSPVTPNPVNPTPASPSPVTPNPVNPTPASPSPVTPNPVNPTPASPSPVTPNPPTSITPEATQAPQEKEPKGEESRVTPESAEERAPLVVKLPTSENN